MCILRRQCLAESIVVVVGMGEVGKPLFRILSRTFECAPVDIQPVEIKERCAVLHLCYPYQGHDFVDVSARYIEEYGPSLTMIHSTVAPGTTREISDKVAGRAVIYSPVRGKHDRMEADMLRYKKFVAGFNSASVEAAQSHLSEAGFKTDTFKSPEVGELSKLMETTYFGVLIAWAQEMERLGATYDAAFDDIISFVEEVDFLPSNIFPGVIGGHCVMPNIAILRKQFKSDFLEAVVNSNSAKAKTIKAKTMAPGQTLK
jgi:UDP-glucose 6-dehydrogenase